jgi:hypothetical protein
MPNLIDITGHRLGTFTVSGRAPGASNARSAWWLVACDCGAEVEIRGDILRAGAQCSNCTDCGYQRRPRVADGRIERPLHLRLEENSEFVTECGCQIWTGDIDQNGYGKIRVDGHYMGAHRASWIASNGPIPAGLFILHRCDLPPCINPDHLFPGTHSQNIADYWAKRRRFERLVQESRAA